MSESHKNIKVINLNEFDNFLNTSPKHQQGGSDIQKTNAVTPAVTPSIVSTIENPLNIKDDASEVETTIEGDVDYSDIISEDDSEVTQFLEQEQEQEQDEQVQYQEEQEEEQEEEEDDDDKASTVSTSSTIQMLGGDPLFLVLSEYLVNKKGDNIVTVLDKLNDNIEKLISLYTTKQ
jgi:hypothetical protein